MVVAVRFDVALEVATEQAARGAPCFQPFHERHEHARDEVIAPVEEDRGAHV